MCFSGNSYGCICSYILDCVGKISKKYGMIYLLDWEVSYWVMGIHICRSSLGYTTRIWPSSVGVEIDSHPVKGPQEATTSQSRGN